MWAVQYLRMSTTAGGEMRDALVCNGIFISCSKAFHRDGGQAFFAARFFRFARQKSLIESAG
jgi:hypothetical protein